MPANSPNIRKECIYSKKPPGTAAVQRHRAPITGKRRPPPGIEPTTAERQQLLITSHGKRAKKGQGPRALFRQSRQIIHAANADRKNYNRVRVKKITCKQNHSIKESANNIWFASRYPVIT